MGDREILAEYLGTPSTLAPPGDIMQDRSIFIGDLGPDMPFALDYRQTNKEPSVIFLSIYGGWRQVAPTVADLMSSLELGGSF